MTMRTWWIGLSHAYRNAYVLIAFDAVIFFGNLFGVRVLQAAWETFTGYLPNIYGGIFMHLLAWLRLIIPSSTIISGVALDVLTMFLSLLSLHVIIGFGVGFLFDHTVRSRLWTFVSYATLILVLFTVHFFLIIAAYL